MLLPFAVRHDVDSRVAAHWDRHYAVADPQRDRRIEEGLWRRTQVSENAVESGWSGPQDARRRLLFYRFAFDLVAVPGGCREIAVTEVYLFYSLALPAGQLEAQIDGVAGALEVGAWRSAGGRTIGIAEIGSRERTGSFLRGDLMCRVSVFDRHPVDLGDPQRTVAAYHALLRRGPEALQAIRDGLGHENAAVREGCCRLLDHLVDTDSMDLLITMADDPDAKVRISTFHALACDRCKEDACAPSAHLVLEPALRHLATDPEPKVRMMAAELVGKFAHTTPEAADALTTAHTNDSSPAVRKVAGWYAPGGTIYRKTAPAK